MSGVTPDATTQHDEKLDKIWRLISDAHSALLVTATRDGTLDSRPMGCVQRGFEGKVWFLTFANSSKVKEIADNSHVLVSYARPAEYEYVSLSGRAQVTKDDRKARELWSEGFRVWFPSGLDDPDLVVISIDVDEVKYWTDAASVVTYAWAYVKARVVGKRPSTGQIADVGSIKL